MGSLPVSSTDKVFLEPPVKNNNNINQSNDYYDYDYNYDYTEDNFVNYKEYEYNNNDNDGSNINTEDKGNTRFIYHFDNATIIKSKVKIKEIGKVRHKNFKASKLDKISNVLPLPAIDGHVTDYNVIIKPKIKPVSNNNINLFKHKSNIPTKTDQDLSIFIKKEEIPQILDSKIIGFTVGSPEIMDVKAKTNLTDSEQGGTLRSVDFSNNTHVRDVIDKSNIIADDINMNVTIPLESNMQVDQKNSDIKSTEDVFILPLVSKNNTKQFTEHNKLNISIGTTPKIEIDYYSYDYINESPIDEANSSSSINTEIDTYYEDYTTTENPLNLEEYEYYTEVYDYDDYVYSNDYNNEPETIIKLDQEKIETNDAVLENTSKTVTLIHNNTSTETNFDLTTQNYNSLNHINVTSFSRIPINGNNSVSKIEIDRIKPIRAKELHSDTESQRNIIHTNDKALKNSTIVNIESDTVTSLKNNETNQTYLYDDYDYGFYEDFEYYIDSTSIPISQNLPKVKNGNETDIIEDSISQIHSKSNNNKTLYLNETQSSQDSIKLDELAVKEPINIDSSSLKSLAVNKSVHDDSPLHVVPDHDVNKHFDKKPLHDIPVLRPRIYKKVIIKKIIHKFAGDEKSMLASSSSLSPLVHDPPIRQARQPQTQNADAALDDYYDYGDYYYDYDALLYDGDHSPAPENPSPSTSEAKSDSKLLSSTSVSDSVPPTTPIPVSTAPPSIKKSPIASSGSKQNNRSPQTRTRSRQSSSNLSPDLQGRVVVRKKPDSRIDPQVTIL